LFVVGIFRFQKSFDVDVFLSFKMSLVVDTLASLGLATVSATFSKIGHFFFPSSGHTADEVAC
jgi:hypothetical protein